MNIGIAGPFNPMTVRDYFDDKKDLPDINSMATSVNAYVNGLLKLGHHVTIFTCYSFCGSPYYIEGKNITIWFISTNFKHFAFGRFHMVKRINKCIYPFVDTLDVLHAEWTYEYALAIKPFHNRIPLYCSVRDWAPYLLSIAKSFGDKYYWVYSYCIFRRVMRGHAINFIANSEYTKNQILSRYPDKKVAIISNPMDPQFILEQRTDYPEYPVFISISTSPFTPRKNNMRLLEAFSKYKKNNAKARMIIVGECTDDKKEMLNKQGLLEGVELTGSLSHDAVIRMIDRSTCLIHSAVEETFGNILLEGMARRVPCIGGKNAGAVPQILGNGKYGILCDVESPESIFEAMKSLDDKSKVDEIINESTKYLMGNYPDYIIAQKHIVLFQERIEKEDKEKKRCFR